MPSPRGNWYPIDLSIKQDQVDLANGDTVVVGGVVPTAGVVKEIWAGQTIAPTAGTLAVEKQTSTAVSLLATANVALESTTYFPTADIASHTAKKLTPSTSNAVLTVAAGDLLTATWALTTITVAGADDLYTCVVLVEPNEW
jgi:hypothetical protein